MCISPFFHCVYGDCYPHCPWISLLIQLDTIHMSWFIQSRELLSLPHFSLYGCGLYQFQISQTLSSKCLLYKLEIYQSLAVPWEFDQKILLLSFGFISSLERSEWPWHQTCLNIIPGTFELVLGPRTSKAPSWALLVFWSVY
jgi:hypothetical protein